MVENTVLTEGNMKIKKGLVLTAFALMLSSFLLMACNNTKEPQVQNNGENAEKPEQNNRDEINEDKQFTGKYMISSDEAVGKIGDENVIFIDARGTDAAEKGTVDGAMALMWQDLSNMSGKSGDEMWGTVLPKEQLSEKLSGLGLDPQKEIILFADANKGWGNDGRILWTLRMAGYNNIKMVDGGIEALSASGAELVKKVNTLDAVTVEISNMDYTASINTDELNVSYDDYKIIDTRAKDEFEGATKFGEAKGGHLPGAVNIDYVDLFGDNGLLKSNADIKKMFEDKGIGESDAAITYCTAGIRSAYVQLVLEMCGFENIKNYDESYYRWSAVNEVE